MYGLITTLTLRSSPTTDRKASAILVVRSCKASLVRAGATQGSRKILVTGAVIALAGPWMLDQMVGYTHDLYSSIPTMVGK